ncbi:MAG: glycosyltransferase family 4 protein [Anaerolineae bacterium]
MRVAWFGHRVRERGNGLISYSREITRALETRGAEITFFYHGDESEEDDDPSSIRLGSFRVLSHDLITAPGAGQRIEETLKQRRSEIAHVSLSFSLIDIRLPELCHRVGVPLVGTVHFPYDERLTLWSGGARILYRLWSRPLARFDGLIVFSSVQRDLLAEYGVPAEKIHVIPNGVDTDLFRPGASEYKARQEASLLIAYHGRLDPEKNVDTLAETFRQLGLPRDHRLVLVGDGIARDQLMERYRGENVIFEGLVTDKPRLVELLRGCDIWALPSDVEGLSLAMLEAMSCGLATVATDVGSDGEALSGAGIVVERRHLKEQLPLALRLLVEYPELRRELGRRARQRVLDRYSLERHIDRLQEVYETLV